MSDSLHGPAQCHGQAGRCPAEGELRRAWAGGAAIQALQTSGCVERRGEGGCWGWGGGGWSEPDSHPSTLCHHSGHGAGSLPGPASLTWKEQGWGCCDPRVGRLAPPLGPEGGENRGLRSEGLVCLPGMRQAQRF